MSIALESCANGTSVVASVNEHLEVVPTIPSYIAFTKNSE